MKTRLRKWDEYSDLKITKDFTCKATSPIVKHPIFQPVVLVESTIRHKSNMYADKRTSKSRKTNVSNILDDWSTSKNENNVKPERHTPRRVEDPNKKPLTDLNRSLEKEKNEKTAGIFELSENFDDEVLSSPKKTEYESDSDSYDYNTVVDALRKIKQRTELNSSQDTSSDSDSNLLRKILQDPEKLSEKVKESINYKALEKLKKSLEENDSASKNAVQPTRVSVRRKINTTNTRFGADFEIPIKRTRKKKPGSRSFDSEFQLKTLKLLEKILLKNTDSDSEFESSIKKEFRAELKAGLKSEFKKKEKKSEEKVKDAIDKIDSELDALALFKESWISSEDLDLPTKSPTKSPKKPPVRSDAKTDVRIVQPKNIKFESGLKLDDVFNESYSRPKPKSKSKSKGGGKKKKQPSMTERTLNKKSKTFFEELDLEPKKMFRKVLKKEEKVEKPKIIPYVPLVEAESSIDPTPMIEVKDMNFIKDWHNHSRPNILGRSYNDPKLKGGDRRNSSDSDKYHDTLYYLLKKEEETEKPVKKINVDLRVNSKNSNVRNKDVEFGEKLRKLELRKRKMDDGNEGLMYENYVGEDYWTNRGRRHVTKNAPSFIYPDSDTGEEDRSHESAIERALWDHMYAKRDRPNLNVNYQTQTCLYDHTYMEAQQNRHPPSLTPSIDTSSMDYSAPNSPLPDSEDTSNTCLSGSMSLMKNLGEKRTSFAGGGGGDDEDDDSYLDPIGFTDESDVEVEDEPKKNKHQYDHFKKMQKKLMRALEKSKGKGRKEKFALVKRFFAEEVFKKKEVKTHGFEHNIKERERRKEMRTLFLNLADELPDLPENPSKIQILQMAEQQVKALSRSSNILLADLGTLKSRQIILKRRVQSLLEVWKADRAKRKLLANF